MITDRIGRNEVLLPINHNCNKIFDGLALLKIKTQEIPGLFLRAVKKKSHLSTRVRCCVLSNFLGMTRTVLLHCPISAEVRTVYSQSDLRILL